MSPFPNFFTMLYSAQIFLAISCHAYFADWSVLAGDRQPTCVSIPQNMSLCHNIGYTKMRLPNLLEHDSMQEASQQAASWVPLLNVKCHADSKLFLCSLFAPVCLERPIYPCRSLCQKVKAGCEGTMKTYGFPWPTMLDCDKFPLDNDMCIASQSDKEIDGELFFCYCLFVVVKFMLLLLLLNLSCCYCNLSGILCTEGYFEGSNSVI